MLASFIDTFHPEHKLKDKRLTNNSPCNECKTYKEYMQKITYGNIAERCYSSLPDSCKSCIKRANYEIDCMNKLRWYEDHDGRLKNN